MLADFGASRRSAKSWSPISTGPWYFRARASGEFDVEHAAKRIELRIVEQVAGLGDRRKGYIDAVEHFGKLGKLIRATMSATIGRKAGRSRTRSSLVL